MLSVKPVRSTLTFEEYVEGAAAALQSTQLDPDRRRTLHRWAVQALGDAIKQEEQGADFTALASQPHARRGLEIAAAGGHAALLLSSSGQTNEVVAQVFVSILPATALPYPLHICPASRVWAEMRDGEPGVAQAHGGVLFLKQFQEVSLDGLVVLREALERHEVLAGEKSGTRHSYPARFHFLAAAAPCPCGKHGSLLRTCSCPSTVAKNYRKWLKEQAQALFSLQLILFSEEEMREMPGPENYTPETSEQVQQRVEAARALQRTRYAQEPTLWVNDDLDQKHLANYCPLEHEAARLYDVIQKQQHAPTSLRVNCLKVARTIADLTSSPTICANHLAEAIALCAQL